MAKSQIAQTFSVRQGAAFSGLSMAMVNYLCRQGILVPSAGRRRGRGVQRLFSFGDIVVLRAVAKLLDGGVSVYRLRRALKTLRAFHPGITASGMPAAYLVTDGQDVLLRHRSGVLELLTSGQFSFAFVVEMESVRREAVAFARSHEGQVAQSVDRRRRAGLV
jgi:DNA-binding transcriptional MerR regulator